MPNLSSNVLDNDDGDEQMGEALPSNVKQLHKRLQETLEHNQEYFGTDEDAESSKKCIPSILAALLVPPTLKPPGTSDTYDAKRLTTSDHRVPVASDPLFTGFIGALMGLAKDAESMDEIASKLETKQSLLRLPYFTGQDIQKLKDISAVIDYICSRCLS